MKSNPWLASYLIGNSPDRYAQLEHRAVPQSIKGESIAARAEVLRAQMREVFLCGDQTSLLLDQLLAIGEGHALTHYGSSQQVLSAIYHQDPWGEATQPALMLTGLAGTGKTQIMQAMRRLLRTRVGRVDLPGHHNLEILPAWFMSLREGNTLNSLLGPWVVPDRAGSVGVEIPNKKDLKQAHLMQLARRVSRRDGVCIIFLDEFQFITNSPQANALAMTLLLQLLSVGPRVIYVANYSLVRRLLNRRQEDRHRVLVNHLELQPDAMDSADFLNYIRELTRIVPADFRFEPQVVASLLHRYTYGIKRAVVELLVRAWAHSKIHRGAQADVTESDLKAAYASSGYMPFRNDVEALWRHSVRDKNIDPDLLNPLRTETPASNVVVAQAAINDFNRRVNERHVQGMLTPSERDALSKLEPPRKALSSEGKVRRLPVGATSKESLLNVFSRLGDDL
ncbi:AAA family ATPase [Comamonas thiooxydans]|uniref:AAA family ATPase n=1 Tax=Comamonas thiooxydans TaxID=363952 RepID=UPI000B06331E|nr:AAA family ATPase [Comamonas thiooxydans]